eukprot:2521912-Pleurochrysis_carterae.AAC.1
MGARQPSAATTVKTAAAARGIATLTMQMPRMRQTKATALTPPKQLLVMMLQMRVRTVADASDPRDSENFGPKS